MDTLLNMANLYIEGEKNNLFKTWQALIGIDVITIIFSIVSSKDINSGYKQ